MRFKDKKYIYIVLIVIGVAGSFAAQHYISKKSIEIKKVSTSSANSDLATFQSFLSKNYSNIDLKDDAVIKQFNILEEDAKNNEVFFTGENHATTINYPLRLAFLKYFNQKAGVTYFLAEIGYSSSCYINEYLATGDESYLKLTYSNSKSTLSYSKEEYNFWIDLRKYNLSLPLDKRIKVIGIDVEHQLETACSYLRYMLRDKDTEGINKLTGILNLDESGKLKDFTPKVLELQKDMAENKNTYEQYFGKDFFDVSLIVDNIVNSINFYNANPTNGISDIRESSIYSNFKRVYAHLPKGKYYGQFGGFHIMQQPYEDNVTFCTYLNREDSPVRNKVITILYDYRNTYYTNKNKKFSGDSSFIDDQLVKEYCKTDATLFKLTGKNSPFNQKSDYVDKSILTGAANYFQYIVMIMKSDAVTPYDAVE